MPFPGTLQDFFRRCVCLPAKHLVGLVDITPDLFDITLTTGSIGPVHLHAGSLLEAFDHFQRREALARTDIKHFYGIGLRLVEHALHRLHVGLGQIHHIDIVADTGLVWRVVVVTEYLQLLTDTHSGLCHEGDEVHGHAIGQFANECRGMGADGVEVSQDDALDGSTRVDIVLDNLLVDLLRVAVRTHRLLDGSVLRHRQVLLRRLAIDGATGREDDALHVVLRHQFKQIDQRNEVIAIVEQRLLHALANGL